MGIKKKKIYIYIIYGKAGNGVARQSNITSGQDRVQHISTSERKIFLRCCYYVICHYGNRYLYLLHCKLLFKMEINSECF